MLWRFALVSIIALGLLGPARRAEANGRAPGTSTINFRQGHEMDIVAGMTFGLVVSHDGGTTWNWMCENAVGYGGMYDPDYAYSPTGALFATTFNGLKVNRDSCVFGDTVEGPNFVSTVTIAPDASVLFGAVQNADPTMGLPGDSDIHKSTDDGLTMPGLAMPGILGDWWQSLEVAPSDASRVYLAGFRFPTGMPKTFLLFRSVNGGTDWTPMSLTGITAMEQSTIEIAGISKTNPDVVFARVVLEDNSISDALYRSIDAGAHWTRILGKNTSLHAFVVRSNGDLLVGTQGIGSWVSHDNGDTWLPLTNPPHANCYVENALHEVWACSQNFGVAGVATDDAGIMKSTDLVTWTKVLRYQDILAPVSCPAGTPQHDSCDVMLWCGLCSQLGCNPGRECATDFPDGPPVGADAAGPGSNLKKGCCDVGGPGAPASALALGAVVGIVLLRRRRR